MAVVASEVRRLLAAFEANRSFRTSAGHLLEMIECSSYVSSPSLHPPDPLTLTPTFETPLIIRIALGRLVANGQPIPSEWALSLLRTLLANQAKPMTRCRPEFDALFQLLYRERFGAGIVVRPPKERITVSYRPASSGLRGPITKTLDDIPDVAPREELRKPLREIGSACSEQLDAYSRYLGRNPEARGSLRAAALLPAELLLSQGGAAVNRLREWILGTVASEQPVIVPVDDLIANWAPGRKEKKLSKAEAVTLAATLAALGFGIEPDVRFGGATPKQGALVAAFRLASEATAAPSPEYAAAAVLVHLCTLVAAADGVVTDDEREHLAEHIETALKLDRAERQRLAAHVEWLVASKASLAGLKKRIEQVEVSQRAAIGSLLVDVAAADGIVTPNEITTLTGIYRLLGLEEADVYSAINNLGTDDTGPVPVRMAGEEERRWDLPAPGSSARGRVRLDPEKVQARLADTAAVTALLADVFAQDSADSTPPQTAPNTAPIASDDVGDVLPGLDAALSELARSLCDQGGCSFAEAEGIAAGLGLPMLEGALERINECAFDVCGEPLIEGDDLLVVNDYAVKELLDAR